MFDTLRLVLALSELGDAATQKWDKPYVADLRAAADGSAPAFDGWLPSLLPASRLKKVVFATKPPVPSAGVANEYTASAL